MKTLTDRRTRYGGPVDPALDTAGIEESTPDVGLPSDAATGAADVPPTARPRLSNRFTRKRLLWGGAIILAAVAVAASFRPTPIAVDLATVTRGPLEVTVEAEGVTRVRDRYLVAAPVTGRVERIDLREGDAVAAGSTIARITPAPLDPLAATQARARVAAAEAAREEAEARYAQISEQRAQVERTTARFRAVAAEGAISVDALDRSEAQLASVFREEEAAASRLRAAGAELSAARAALLGVDPVMARGRGTAVVRSPSPGRVLRILETSERVVAAGTPLVAIGDPTVLEVVVDVLSTDAVRIQPGAMMRLVDWGGDSPLEARVHLVEPAGFTKRSALGVEEQRVNVVGELQDASAGIGDAFRVQAHIVTWQADDVIRVPTTALFRTGEGWAVFAVEEGRARLRSVQIGHRGAGEAEVLGGLDEADPVVLFPSDLVSDGVRVRPRS